MNKCDIIIPIYNAFDCLEKCLDSIIENTNLEENSIICINDKSTDDRVLPLLKKYEKKYKFIKLLENEENKGFVGTVNRGMQYSKNDVLLLNSDTEVEAGWLDNIKKYAYSQPKIASVTPLSNNATLVSVPVGLQRNELPKNMSFKEYAKIVNETAYDETFELPTAHGFCMYIRREALDIVGYFDEKTFGKGYGEENDFSFRALDYGFKNILCPNTIVYHKESQSFSEKRAKLVEEHGKILQERYPVYNTRVGLWCQNFPIKKICENIDYQIKLHNKKNVLMLIHDWDINHLGGTTMHVYDIVKANRKKMNIHILAPSNGIYKLYSYFEDSEKVINLKAIDNSGILSYYNNSYKKMLEDVIEGFRINTIHIHHMISHYFDIIDVAKMHNIKSIITLHDLYALCPTINMLYKMEEYCIPLKDKKCDECIHMKTSLRNNIVPSWQEEWNKFLQKFDRVIVPSENTKKIINGYYKNVDIEVIEHGIEYEENNYNNSIEEKDAIDVAIVGVVSIHKGGNILKELVKVNNDKIRIHLFGATEIKELEKSRNNYIYHGRYERKNLPKLLKENNINLICLLSIWPETYSYTLTESIASNIPVLSFNIGAIADRISKNDLGWTIPITKNVKELEKKIEDIFDNKDDFKKVLKNINDYHVKTIEEMGKDYYEIYNKDELIELNGTNSEAMKRIIEKSCYTTETVSSSEAAWIMNSLRWKIVSKIKVPEFMKKIIRKVVR
ncbi:MAG: glycosyltransferase [Firmicutes bacterium]|nr:glycosyltransferase [Bacillota bacterium]